MDQSTDPGSDTAYVSWPEPIAIDNSGFATLSASHHPGHSFPIGETTVTYTAVDPYSNKATKSFIVSIRGNFDFCSKNTIISWKVLTSLKKNKEKNKIKYIFYKYKVKKQTRPSNLNQDWVKHRCFFFVCFVVVVVVVVSSLPCSVKPITYFYITLRNGF